MKSFAARTAILLSHGPDQHNAWIADGWAMARREGDGAFESIALRHAAEHSAFQVATHSLKARGAASLREHQEIDECLAASGLDPARHLQQVAQGRIDRMWAVGLTVLSGVMAVFAVSVSTGSIWLAAPF